MDYTFMDILVILSFLFVTGSFIGWVIELFFRRFLSKNNPERKWINPGFLTGPYLPIYGFGLTALFLMSILPFSFIKNEFLKDLCILICMAIAMTVIEYITGKIFIISMHVKLWDYSNEWGNIEGVICPKFSLYWTALGAVYYFLIQPHVVQSLRWLFNNLTYCLIIGYLAGIYTIDIIYSLNVVTKIRKFAVDNDIVVRYETLKSAIITKAEETRTKVRFLTPFRSEVPLIEHLEKYLEVYDAFGPKI